MDYLTTSPTARSGALSGAVSDALSGLDNLVQQLTGPLLSQHARLISMDTAQGSALPETLVVEAFTGYEAVNALFLFDIDAFSVSTEVDLKQFIGEEITLRLLQADGSRRAWHGYCTQAYWLGADGGTTRYRLRLEPFLSFLRLRRDSFIFQDKDVQQIVTDLLADYPQAHFRWDVTQPLLARPVCTQYRESDLDFFTRLLASEGLSWRFDHDQSGSGSGAASSSSSSAHSSQSADSAHSAGDVPHAKHTLVIFDAQATAPDLVVDFADGLVGEGSGSKLIRFHGVRASESSDAINQFSARRSVQANAVSLSSWDARQVSAPAAESASGLDNGMLPSLSLYDGAAEQRYVDSGMATQHSELVLQALELRNKTFSGAGAVRCLASGYVFQLSQHDHYGADGTDNAFTVLSVRHQATNNLGAGMATMLSSPELERGTYRNQFTCVRQVVPIVPEITAWRRAPVALGAQVALVVGLDATPLTTDRDHRIKVQFPWQRGAVPVAGGLTESGASSSGSSSSGSASSANNSNNSGNAPGNETSGTWVRVAEALSGPNWGSNFTPRIGSEVLVDFIENEMDRPVVVASLFNGADLPPYAAGVDSGVNHAGVLSGFHSQNLGGDGYDGYNQWAVDDTVQQLRMRLATSTAASQLNLGYLIAQAPASAQRGAYRGQGFELRSDAWGVVRGAQGLLLSTTQRSVNGSSVTSTQLDVAESVAQLKGAASLSDALSQAASHQQALISKEAMQAQTALIKAIDPQQAGKYPGPVNGQEALKPASGSAGGTGAGGNRALDAAQPVEKFASPLMHLESASSINWASPASTALFAGQHLQWTTQTDSHWAAAMTTSL
ncbi:type VI secretion system secreted protein VgrG, partial [Undibacterium sp. GrIS 1.8]|uniref:type VI secretion system Vgr family protein n=2 Tax=unclassified Undibacterium TaxID=2630295 RepID=UPI003398A256